MLLAEGEGRVPGLLRGLDEVGRALARVEGGGDHGKAFVFGVGRSVGRPAMVPHHAEHVRLVGLVAGEGPEGRGHAGRLGIGLAGEDGGEGGGHGAAAVRVVGEAHHHEEAAEVRVAEAEGAVVVAPAGNLLRGELGHDHGDLEDYGPDAHRVAVGDIVEAAGLRVVEGKEVERREVAGRVVEEHVLGAGIGGADLAVGGTSVPLVDGPVELEARIGALPGGARDAVPEGPRLDRLHGLLRDAAHEVPVRIVDHRLHEAVVEAHGVVGGLARDGVVGFAFPGGVVGGEGGALVALAVAREELVDVGGGKP